MISTDISDLYTLGTSLQSIRAINKEESYWEAWLQCYVAYGPLDHFVSNSAYSATVKITMTPARALLARLRELSDMATTPDDGQKVINPMMLHNLLQALDQFESVFKPEIAQLHTYLATQKGAYDVRTLIEDGEKLFPTALKQCCPDAIEDVKAGARCLVFDLYTASAFHFHRVNETVLLAYLESLKIDPMPERSMGKYIAALETAEAPPGIVSCLRDVKNMHRNPLMHPEESIDNVDDAIALRNAIHCSVNAMLKEMNQAS